MLRVLAENDDRYETLIPDGIYGNATMSTVAKFQKNHGLNVTGITDQDTWDAIVAAYEPALVNIDQAQSIEIILNPVQVIRRGEKNPYLYIAQAMLAVLAEVYESIGTPSHTGILDHATADALSSFQALAGLPMTGNLDKMTWKHLSLHFPLAATLKTNLE
jgi:peptidoglycan hydrolase-like protein with peptidoglycan-binding domain